MKTKLISLLVILSTLTVSVLTSCSSEATETKDTTADSASDTTVNSAEFDRASYPDALPDLDFDGETVSVLYRDINGTPGYETNAEQNGDVINDAVYNRNISVAERLNISFKFTGDGSAPASDLPENATASILSGEDLYSFWVWGQANSLKKAIGEMLTNLSHAKYLDFDKPWWNNSYTKEINVMEDSLYNVANDMLISDISRMSSMFVNQGIFESLYGDIDKLYGEIMDGSFTYDLFNEYIADVYSDTNGDGSRDLEDTYGVMATTVSNTDHFTYTAGLTLSKRDENGAPTLDVMNEHNAAVFDKVKELYYTNNNFFILPETEIIDGTAERRFASGQMLFYPLWFSAVEYLRDMEADYGIIPYPKFDDTQEEYRSLIQNTASVISVPKTVQNIEMVTATIEALAAESYRSVVPAYYETGLKVKYSRDNISTQMIDLIYSVASSDVLYAFSASVAGLGTISRTVVGQNKDFASTYAELETKATTALEELVDIFG